MKSNLAAAVIREEGRNEWIREGKQFLEACSNSEEEAEVQQIFLSDSRQKSN